MERKSKNFLIYFTYNLTSRPFFELKQYKIQIDKTILYYL